MYNAQTVQVAEPPFTKWYLYAPIIIIIGSLRAFPNGTCLVCALHGKVAVFGIRNLGLNRRWARLESLPTILHREDRNLTPAVLSEQSRKFLFSAK